MKKTITIMLVLAIAITGIFAEDVTADTDDATLQIQTTVSPLTGFKVTSATAWDTMTYADFTGMTTADLISVTRDGGLGGTAFITAANNSTTAYEIGMTATAMIGQTGGTDSTIDYTVSVDSDSDSDDEDAIEFDTSTDTEAVTVLSVTGGNDGMVISSKEISVALDTVSYDDAKPDTYVGLITFSVVSN
jgi:hypothetical protein